MVNKCRKNVRCKVRGGWNSKEPNWMTVQGILSPGKQAMKWACQGEKKTAQRRKGLPVRVLRIERRSNQPQIRKGRYFAYGRTVVYESWRSGTGIGRVQVLCLQNRAEAKSGAERKGLSDHFRAGKPQVFSGKSLLQRAGKEGFIMAVYKEEKTNTWRVIYR